MDAAPIRLAIIEPVGGHGGMDYYDVGLADSLTLAGADVVLHTCDEFAVPNDMAFEIRHTFAGIYGTAAKWWRGLLFARGLFVALASCAREGRRIVHFHMFHVGMLQMLQVLCAKTWRRCVVITAHDVESFVEDLESETLSRWVYRWADHVVAHNGVSRDELVAKFNLQPGKVSIIPHGGFLHTIPPLPLKTVARSRFGIASSAKVLLFFGQIKNVKGLDLLIEAMPKVLTEHPDCVVLIGGKTWQCDFGDYEKRMSELDIRESCSAHIRYIPNDEVAFFFAAADLVVMPYRRIYQSGVLLMAMSFDKPVLVSGIPGMLEIIEDGTNGFVFRPNDVGDLSRRICTLLDNERQRDDVAHQGLQHVRDNHDWRSIGAQTYCLYTKLI